MKFDLDQLIGFIQKVGFPIVVTCFLLWKLSASVDALILVMLETKENIAYLNAVMRNHVNEQTRRSGKK